MELKDKLSIFISLFALVISLGVFIDAKNVARQKSEIEKEKNSYIAYRLGDKFGVYTVAYLHTTVGTEDEIAAFRKDLLKSIQDPQGYADQLLLRIELSDLFSNYDKDSVFNNRIYTIMSERISTMHDKHVASVYETAFWASWTLMNAKMSSEIGTSDFIVKNFNNTLYPKLQSLLLEIELSNELVFKVSDSKELESMATKLRSVIREKYVI